MTGFPYPRRNEKVEERFIGNAYIYCEKEKEQILKNKVTGPSTQEYLSQFYEELESEKQRLTSRHGKKCSL